MFLCTQQSSKVCMRMKHHGGVVVVWARRSEVYGVGVNVPACTQRTKGLAVRLRKQDYV